MTVQHIQMALMTIQHIFMTIQKRSHDSTNHIRIQVQEQLW